MTFASSPTCRYATLLCMFLLGTLSSTAWAAPPSEADQKIGRTHAIAGAAAYRDKNFEQALKSFEKAQALYPSGQVWRMTGYTLMALERWVPAAEALEKSLKAEFKPLMPRDAEHAEDNLNDVLKHTVALTMRSAAANATVSIDDGDERPLPLELRIGEGMHRFVVRAPGHDALDKSINLEAGKPLTLDLDPNKRAELPTKTEKKTSAPEPPPKPEEPSEPFNLFGGLFPHQRTIGIAVGGVGVALGAAAIATAANGRSLRSAVDENITAHKTNYDPQCSVYTASCLNDVALINRDGQRAQELQQAGLILGITAAVTLAVGGTFFLLAPDGPLASQGSDSPDSAKIACSPWTNPSRAQTQAGLSCIGRF